jgi:tetratricopeptide (TPR) repeat protein
MKGGRKEGMRENIPSAISLIGAVFILSILPAQVHALTPEQVFSKVKDSIVVVRTLDAQGKMKSQGSGVLISSGRVATNCHVGVGGASYQVGRGKKIVRATLYAEDGDKDICLLDAKGITGKPAQLGKAENLKVGGAVYAVGAPQGLELSISDGIVAQLRGGPPPLIQTTTAISSGSSGGGLFDEEGRLVGLTTLYVEGGQNLNFAMPVEWIGEVKPGRKAVVNNHSQTEWLKHAIALEKLKNWQGMLDWCQKWTKSEPENVSAWDYLAMACDNLKLYDGAIEAYLQCLRINPKYADAWYNLGSAYKDLKRYEEAIKAYRQVISINPEDAEAWYNLGIIYGLSGQKGQVMEVYGKLKILNSAKADEFYKNVNVVMPVQPSAFNDRQKMNDIKAINESLEIALKDSERLKTKLGKGNKTKIKKEHQNQIKKIAATDLRIKGLGYSTEALTTGNYGYYQKAIDAYEEAIILDPQNVNTYTLCASMYSLLKKHKEAVNISNKLIKRYPKLADGYFARGLAYNDSGNFSQAIKDYDIVIKLDPDKWTVYSYKGMAYFNKGDYVKAINEVTIAINIAEKKINQKDDNADRIVTMLQLSSDYSLRGRAYYLIGNGKLAISDFSNAIELLPNYKGNAISYALRTQANFEDPTNWTDSPRSNNFLRFLSDINMAIELSPNESQYYSYRAKLYFGYYLNLISERYKGTGLSYDQIEQNAKYDTDSAEFVRIIEKLKNQVDIDSNIALKLQNKGGQLIFQESQP